MHTLSMRIVTYLIEYLGKFELIFKTILDYESEDQMGSFDAKKPPSKISCLGTFCSLPLWRVHEIKLTYLASRTHCLHIYNLNTVLLYAAFTQYHDTYTQINSIKSRRNPLLISPLLSWNPSFCVVLSFPRLLLNWPPPPHSLPIPNSHPLRAFPV